MSVEVDVWYVKLADGDVERVTLDELDEAFQRGQIDENSMVLAAGSEQWMKLSDLLNGADATPPPPPPTPAPQSAAQPWAPPGQAVRAPAMARPASGLPAQAVMTVPPPAAAAFPVASTLRPMSLDLGDDGVAFPRAPSRKGRVVVALGVAAALGAAAFVVVKRNAASAAAESSAPAFAAAAAQAPAAPPPEPAATTPPAPMQASMTGPSSVMDPTRADPAQRLSDAQKQKLLDADKKGPAHGHAHSGGGGAMSHSPSAPRNKSASASFTTGGSKYDPLNSSL
jgi:hypothetical protein